MSVVNGYMVGGGGRGRRSALGEGGRVGMVKGVVIVVQKKGGGEGEGGQVQSWQRNNIVIIKPN